MKIWKFYALKPINRFITESLCLVIQFYLSISGRFGRARLWRNVLDCSRQKHKQRGIEHIFQMQSLAKIDIKNIVYFIFTSKYTYEWIESTLLI